MGFITKHTNPPREKNAGFDNINQQCPWILLSGYWNYEAQWCDNELWNYGVY
jgi:hypothetical protein